jgi:hypothetical protein
VEHPIEPTRRFFSWDAAIGYVVASLILTAVHAAYAGFVDIALLKQIISDSNCVKTGKP